MLHIVDVSGIEGRDPIEDFDTINNELKMYSEKLSKKPQIVLANKADIPQFDENFDKFKAEMERREYTVFKNFGSNGKGRPRGFELYGGVFVKAAERGR